MTRLDKPIRRLTVTSTSVIGRRRLVVILEPGDILAMRKVYAVLARWYAAEVERKKAEEKKIRKAARYG